MTRLAGPRSFSANRDVAVLRSSVRSEDVEISFLREVTRLVVPQEEQGIEPLKHACLACRVGPYQNGEALERKSELAERFKILEADRLDHGPGSSSAIMRVADEANVLALR